jgi:hypothetical protein
MTDYYFDIETASSDPNDPKEKGILTQEEYDKRIMEKVKIK